MRALLLCCVCLSTAAAAQSVCPPRETWPTAGWPEAPVDAAAKATPIAELETYLFTLEGEDKDREGLRTEGLVIIHEGRLKYEKYARGFTRDNRHLSWSVAKSYSSVLVGIAVREGVLNLSDSICTHLPEYVGTPQCDITVLNAITFSTGLNWQEGYENSTYQESSVIAMLYGVGHRDQLSFILEHRLQTQPGQQWRYSTGDAHLAAALAQRALEKKHGRDAFWKLLFEPIGTPDVIFEADTRGTPLGGSMVYATPRDFAKFGFLMLNDGCWEGARLLPPGWVSTSTTPSDFFVNFAPETASRPSGYSWWLNVTRPPPIEQEPAWPDVPEGAFSANGHWGQFIIVVPSWDLVVVRTGDDRKASVDLNELARLSYEVVR